MGRDLASISEPNSCVLLVYSFYHRGFGLITKLVYIGSCSVFPLFFLLVLFFQDDIAKMNYTLEDARDVGRMLESKQLRENTLKSKYVIMTPKKSRAALLKDAEANPIKMEL